MNILSKIIEGRITAIEKNRRKLSLNQLLDKAKSRIHHSLAESIRSSQHIPVIAEFKRASPSKGSIAPHANPALVATDYEKAGAAGISVLTEPDFFKGSDADLAAVRASVKLPILRKDFIVDPYQIAESAAIGADVILLILAILEKNQALDLYALARELNLEVLAETHSPEEMDTAIIMKDALIGVNSRNLKTLKTDTSILPGMAALIPHNRIAIAESGIKCREDIVSLRASGFSAFLIGEALMNASSQPSFLKKLIA